MLLPHAAWVFIDADIALVVPSSGLDPVWASGTWSPSWTLIGKWASASVPQPIRLTVGSRGFSHCCYLTWAILTRTEHAPVPFITICAAIVWVQSRLEIKAFQSFQTLAGPPGHAQLLCPCEQMDGLGGASILKAGPRLSLLSSAFSSEPLVGTRMRCSLPVKL